MRQGRCRGGWFPTPVGNRTRRAAAGGPVAHRVGGGGAARSHGGRCRAGPLPRGLGLSLEKAQTKEHQGAAAPWTPGGGSRSSLALVGFWVGVSKGRSWVYGLRGIEHRFGTFTHLTGEMGNLDFLGLRKIAGIDALKKYGEMESLIFFCADFSIVGLDNRETISIYRRHPKGTFYRCQPPGGRLALDAWRCVGRRPVKGGRIAPLPVCTNQRRGA